MKFPIFLSLLAVAFVSSCTKAPPKAKPDLVIEVSPQANPWSSLELQNDPNNFQFAIVTDNTGGSRPGVFEDAVTRLNLIQPEFVMSVGDLIQGYTTDRADIDRMWAKFNGYIAKLQMPFFYVPGNHDMANNVLGEEWKKRFGRSYYHFRYRDVLFLCLNSDDPPGAAHSTGHFSQQQIDYVAKALKENQDVRWTMLFFHRPMWTGLGRQQGWDAIEKRLAGRKYTVFAGHLHTYLKHEVGGHQYIDLATTGGALPPQLPDDVEVNEMHVILGSFDQIAWVTMTDNGPEVANLTLDGIWSSNVRTAEIAGWTRSIVNRLPITLMPTFTRDATFARGAMQLRVNNASDFPLVMRGRFEPNPLLRPNPADVFVELPAKSEKSVEIALSSEQSIQTSQATPLAMYWSLEYHTAGAPGLDMRQNLKLRGIMRSGVMPLYDLPKRADAVVVDGKLDEWKNLPMTCDQPQQIIPGRENWRGPQDSSFKFATAYDDKYLYLAARVTDDEQAQQVVKLSQAIAEANRKGEESINTIAPPPTSAPAPSGPSDAIVFRLDSRRDPDRSHGRDSKNFNQMISISCAPPDGDRKSRISKPDRSNLKIEAACVRVDGGYSAEVAIPISYLVEQQGKDWSQMRLNVAVDDYDDKGETYSQIWWRPDWSRDANIIGSGTFERVKP